MVKRRDRFPIGEHEEKLTFRTSVYPLSNDGNSRLEDEMCSIVNPDKCNFSCCAGEVRITKLKLDYAAKIRKLLEGRSVLGGQCTLHEV
ncbi:MAG: hypothetical protein ABIG34_03050 [Candidatus Peregrinibacteria bacterium]